MPLLNHFTLLPIRSRGGQQRGEGEGKVSTHPRAQRIGKKKKEKRKKQEEEEKGKNVKESARRWRLRERAAAEYALTAWRRDARRRQ